MGMRQHKKNSRICSINTRKQLKNTAITDVASEKKWMLYALRIFQFFPE